MEVVAEAAIAWVAALRELAFVVDPSVQLVVEIVDGDRGSLWLNTVLTFFERKLEKIERGSSKYPRLHALARALALIVITTPIAMTVESIWSSVTSDNPGVELSPEERELLARDIARALQPNVAKSQRRQFFQAVEKDSQITEVGVSSVPDTRPAFVVPRGIYQKYLLTPEVDEIEEKSRKWSETWEVTLVSPVLENAERSWRFRREGMPEFGAVMKDREFLAAIERAEVHEELRQGIKMTVTLTFKDKFENGVWVTKERSVVEVIKPQLHRARLPL
ncbi:hypothetical protein CLG96_01980 [Sphingomonas oleivorans]|uniref:Uncharacterized protein n=1 Tax=Sphingomonas oleivorans TaxID=1735121 RepID=A0A2T5G1A6_9SPHN|nr:hypothetical protein CLG96_01980 [Sphingomonas oleivorans]